MRSIVARGVNFGMAVSYMISAEQRAIETIAKIVVVQFVSSARDVEVD